MRTENYEITEPKILAVEGKDEQNFFRAFIKSLSLGKIQVMDIAGKTQFKDRLGALTSTPGFPQVESLGVVRDADDNPIGAFQSVCASLENAKLPVPDRPWHFQTGTHKVIVMIMPDGTSDGMIEDLCLKAVQSDIAMPCVREYIECLQREGVTISNPRVLSKARVQTFLASKPETGISLGIAALKGYWPLSDQTFDQVRQVLQNL